jgi:hypothetical protein
MAGLVINALGRTAVVGDEVEIDGIRLPVKQIDRFRFSTLSLFRRGEKADSQTTYKFGVCLSFIYQRSMFTEETSLFKARPGRGLLLACGSR